MTKEKPAIAPAHRIYGFFLLGLSTAIAFRALIVLDHVQPAWVRPVWYFGVLGNLVFSFTDSGYLKNGKRQLTIISS